MLAARAVAALALLMLMGPAGAEIAIQDPAGDVEIDGLPAGAAGAAYDLREVTLHHVNDHLRITIRLEAVPAPHDSAEFVVVFEANGTWMAGYTALPYTNPAPHYRGGFACPATEDGFVNGSQANDCIGIADWSLDGATYTVDVPLAFIRASNGTVVTDAWAYAEVTPFLKGTSRVDATSREGAMTIGRQDGNESSKDPAGAVETPAPAAGVVWLGIALVAMHHRRRRADDSS